MKVLLIEDDENKRLQLSEFVRDTLPNSDLRVERSLQSGLRSIRKFPPDLILLDMTIPNYDTGPDEPGGQTHIFGGRELLRQMDRFDISIPVIVITQFETFGKPPQTMRLADLDAQLREQHKEVYKGAIYYHAAIHGWKEQLAQLIDVTIRDRPASGS